ncbi:TPA: hypothetical protein ACGTYN_002340 [Klebsiella pneumoniae]|uniref:hypothetical protein n=1 Tax=Klebsiella pneumoniae TaxID=573 RepID=UPI00376C1377
MTNITELAQSLKRRATSANEFGESLYVKADDVLSLVEALEKAQQRIDELENDEVRQRLANAEHQLYMAELDKNNLRASRKAQFRKRKAAEQRIAELESRTVKLPKPISVLHRREFTAAHCAIYAYPEAEVNAALDGAGIKWEAE